MDRAKELLALAPFVALVIAITYLQGYWGVFGILPFPYLSFQELLAYSAAPLFGFLFFVISGALFGVLSAVVRREEEKRRWVAILENSIALLFCGTLIYFDVPDKWLFTPLIIVGLCVPPIFRLPALQAVKDTRPQTAISVLVMLFLVAGSFGYGRSKAVTLVRAKEPNIHLTVGSNAEEGKLIGKLGAYYFVVNSSERVTVIPEQTITRIEYRNDLRGW